MTKPRKYKAKPPISQLDDAAAQHRRAQSCKAQRAYRQRKEDTIATLTTQISDLESTIERLSGCFLGLNDRVLGYLRTIEKEDDQGSGGLAEGIRDAMKEFKEIIESDNVTADKTKATNGDEAVMSKAIAKGRSSPTEQFYPSPAASSGYDIPLQQHQHQQQLSNDQMLATTTFSGPAFFGLTNTTLPHHSLSTLTPSTATQHHHALAARLYHSTINKAYSIVYTSGPPTPLFRRVYAAYFCGQSDEQFKRDIVQMMDQRLVWSCFDKLVGSTRGWWSALQVAGFITSQGGWFDKEQDRVVLRRSMGGQVSMDTEGLLEEFLVDARCGLDDPEYKEETVIQAIMKIMG